MTVAVLAAASSEAGAQDSAKTTVEDRARLARRGAGVAVGTWSQVDRPSGGPTTSDSPILEGYFRKGIDKHLALVTSAGVWRRVVETPASGGIGGSSGGKTTVLLIPQFTGITLFPFTGPEDAFEPYVSGALGITLGFQSESGGGALLGGGGASGLVVGVGASGGAGVEWRLGDAFGLMAGGHYSYVQFFDPLAGQKMYRGTGVKAGLTYRFQY